MSQWAPTHVSGSTLGAAYALRHASAGKGVSAVESHLLKADYFQPRRFLNSTNPCDQKPLVSGKHRI